MNNTEPDLEFGSFINGEFWRNNGVEIAMTNPATGETNRQFRSASGTEASFGPRRWP